MTPIEHADQSRSSAGLTWSHGRHVADAILMKNISAASLSRRTGLSEDAIKRCVTQYAEDGKSWTFDLSETRRLAAAVAKETGGKFVQSANPGEPRIEKAHRDMVRMLGRQYRG